MGLNGRRVETLSTALPNKSGHQLGGIRGARPSLLLLLGAG